MDADGDRVSVEISAVPLYNGHRIVGVFGQVIDVDDDDPPEAHPHLTPRQTEVLRLLERGRSTNQIASELHLSTETVRNHVRHPLRALGVHSPPEARAAARRAHLVGAWPGRGEIRPYPAGADAGRPDGRDGARGRRRARRAAGGGGGGGGGGGAGGGE